MSLRARILHRSVRELTRLACVLALLSLGLMSYSVLFPRPLPVILAMSLGYVLCAGAIGSYALAVLVDATRSKRSKTGEAAAEGSLPPR